MDISRHRDLLSNQRLISGHCVGVKSSKIEPYAIFCNNQLNSHYDDSLSNRRLMSEYCIGVKCRSFGMTWGVITPQVTPQAGTKLALSRHQVSNPSLETDLIEMTIPNKPRSSKQRYRLTGVGRRWLSQHGGAS